MTPQYDNTGAFRFDGWAPPEFTVEREESALLRALIVQGTRIYVDGPRRCGKTTLVINTLEAEDKKFIRIDLDGVRTLPKLIERVKASANSFLNRHPKINDALNGKRGRKAGIETGLLDLFKVHLEASVEHDQKIGASLDDLLWAVSEVARHAKAAVIVDEFQAVKDPLMHNPAEVLGSFATASDPVASHAITSWIFLGSNRHAMGRIFSGIESAFYQKTRHLPVGPIPQDIIIPFLNERTGKTVDPEVGREAFRWTDGIPGDLQRLYSAMLGSANHDASTLTLQDLDRGKRVVLADLGRSYALTLQEVGTSAPARLQLLNLIAQKNVRSLDELAQKSIIEGITEKVVQDALQGLLEMGLLHISRNSTIERPEPLLFHYINSLPKDGFETTAMRVSAAFRRLASA